MDIGIESISSFFGFACIGVHDLFEYRKLDLHRFSNLLMERKSVSLPCEDPVTNAVNAAKPMIDALDAEDRDRIEMVITASESGLDFGKSLSTYIHDYLGLNRRCRLFEIKQACYGGTAALQMAVNFIASNASPNAKVLVIATDVTRATAKFTYAEPSQGTGAVAMLVSNKPEILELDFGANGYHSYEVMDTCRPDVHVETGDPDLSLMSYLDCLSNSFADYESRVEGVDFLSSFEHLVFHTPFGGMVKGAHRAMLRSLRVPVNQIEDDFQRRMQPSLAHCVEVGNIYSATIFMALCSLIDNVELTGAKRIGLFSYGSGCSSEFYSGIITPRSQEKVQAIQIKSALDARYGLNLDEYETLLDLNEKLLFGVKDLTVDVSAYQQIYDSHVEGSGRLVLDSVDANYHRKYRWA
ncbi:3-hydroxy-3-methylglutaryl-ACP synthase [Chromobacterium sp. ATCC 53434]|uniref:hydroxymethylglutaryl-CoA synthase family protein n=1 Tax=Chromobacterium TaxID=535 RepID=UPI000C75AF22|nr:hydroxymethylglutaryl-CoA synthase [Chromobacterium sp. ATCC 53434]AUH52225.1 3-hydroxy-3-methylglutaryl-ACP synthase [Chromobacterium sp. ATCC 53434]